MNYADIMKMFEKQVPSFIEMYDKQLVKLARLSEESGIDVLARWDIATPETERYMRLITSQNNAAIKIETFLTAMVVGAGPKVFRPSAAQCFALEKMKLTLDIADFAMPFDSIVLELPEEYTKSRWPGVVCTILHFNKPTNFFIHCVNYEDGTAYKAWHPIRTGQQVESWFQPTEWKDMGEIPIEIDEIQAEETFRRVALNYCLLLDEVGCHLTGPNSPNQYSELVRLSNNNKVFRKNNKAAVRTHPMVYAIDREVQLVKEVGSVLDLPSEETGRTLSPHCRRGFYKMQPHGPNSSLRKRIRIPAVIVNKHLLTAPPPSQEYRT